MILIIIWVVNLILFEAWGTLSGKFKYFPIALYKLRKENDEIYKEYMSLMKDRGMIKLALNNTNHDLVTKRYIRGVNYCLHSWQGWYVYRDGEIVLTDWTFVILILNPLLKTKFEERHKLR